MTLCPIALVAGCKKCPAFKICPLKTVIGDMPSGKEAASPPTGKTAAKGGAKRKKP